MTEVDVLGRRYKVEDDGTVYRVLDDGRLLPRTRVPHPNQIHALVHRACCGKIAYLSRDGAREAAQEMADRYGPQRPYQCGYETWHLTSN